LHTVHTVLSTLDVLFCPYSNKSIELKEDSNNLLF
jgi:hypothetical protein